MCDVLLECEKCNLIRYIYTAELPGIDIMKYSREGQEDSGFNDPRNGRGLMGRIRRRLNGRTEKTG